MCNLKFFKFKTYIKNKWKIELIELLMGLILLLVTFLILKYVKVFPIINAFLIQKGYNELFKGNFDMSFFLVFLFIIAAMFFYISLWFFLFAYSSKEKHYKKGAFKEFKNFTKIFFKNNKGLLLLILTLSISLSLMYAGIQFLITAFPEENLYVSGITTQSGSFLKCDGNEYLNLISTFDQYCPITLSSKFSNLSLKRVEIRYYLNRQEFTEFLPAHENSKERVILYFDKVKQPQFLFLHFNDSSMESFTLNTKGVYTKEEYFEREKQKATWFFAIISFSLFSVFSAMNNLKDILNWK